MAGNAQVDGSTESGATQKRTTAAGSSPAPVVTATGSIKVPSGFDPARRSDVLFRVRRDEDHEISAWWMIGAFVGTSAIVIALLGYLPGGA